MIILSWKLEGRGQKTFHRPEDMETSGMGAVLFHEAMRRDNERLLNEAIKIVEVIIIDMSKYKKPGKICNLTRLYVLNV